MGFLIYIYIYSYLRRSERGVETTLDLNGPKVGGRCLEKHNDSKDTTPLSWAEQV